MNSMYHVIEIEGKRCFEHRYMMERKLGRKLGKNECVHHINGNKRDNRLENLEVISRSEHNRAHTIKQFSNCEKYNLGPARKIICMETGELFESVSAAARRYSIDDSAICKVCEGLLRTTGGYHWKYAED